MLYGAVFKAIRHFDGSYRPGGRFFDADIPPTPQLSSASSIQVSSSRRFTHYLFLILLSQLTHPSHSATRVYAAFTLFDRSIDP